MNVRRGHVHLSERKSVDAAWAVRVYAGQASRTGQHMGDSRSQTTGCPGRNRWSFLVIFACAAWIRSTPQTSASWTR
jgi:predicted secreted protein